MKNKLLLSFLLLFSLGTAFAQKNSQQFTLHPYPGFQWNTDKTIDTVLMPPINPFCVPSATVGLITAFGVVQVGGTNSYGDLEKTQKFLYPGGGDITGILAGIGLKWQGTVGGTTNYTAKIYSVSGSGAPGALLGTSQNVAYSAIDTVTDFTLFNFSSPVSVTDSFFVSVVVSNGIPGTDSIAVLQVYDGSNFLNPCGRNTAWELQADTTWHLMSGGLSTEWGIDIQFVMSAIINTPNTGTHSETSFHTYRAFPNPAHDLVNISWSLKQSADVQIFITDISGRMVYTNTSPQISGACNQTVDVKNFADGLYTYTIATKTNSVTGKFIVLH